MSRHHTEEIVCPSCQHKGIFEIWDSINTVLNPEMKEKVLSQEIFKYTCPSCNQTFNLPYSTLYHQMEDSLMIYLVSESAVQETQELFLKGDSILPHSNERFLKRIVTTPNELIEKIQIFDAGKDDRVIELVKTVVAGYMHQTQPEQLFDDLFFATDEEGNDLIVTFHEGKITGSLNYGNLYEEIASDFNLMDIHDDDIIINQTWSIGKFNEQGAALAGDLEE